MLEMLEGVRSLTMERYLTLTNTKARPPRYRVLTSIPNTDPEWKAQALNPMEKFRLWKSTMSDKEKVRAQATKARQKANEQATKQRPLDFLTLTLTLTLL